MPIVETTIENAVGVLIDNMYSYTDPEEAKAFYKTELTKIIVDAITSADVTGITTLVSTVGSATAQTGTGTQNNIGKLS